MPTFYDQIPTFRKIGGFFTWRRVRWFLLVSVSVVTLFAVYFTEEDWRGRRMWDAYIKELAAQGMPVTFADLDKFKPVPVPDDQNFWGAPVMKQLVADSNGNMVGDKISVEFSWDKLAGKNPKWGMVEQNPDYDYPFMLDGQVGMPPSNGTGHLFDVSDWKTGLDQPDLVEAFKKFDPALDEIAVAARRPFVRPLQGYQGYSGSTWEGVFWYENFDLSGVYELRGLVELDAGQTDRAAGDVVTLLGSCDKVTGVRVFDPTSGLQVLWQGLVTHRWTDGQLAAMQAALQKVDYFPLLVQDYRRSTVYYIGNLEGLVTDSLFLADRIRPSSGLHPRPYWWYWLRVVLYPQSRMYRICLDDLQAYEAMQTAFDISNRKIDGVKLHNQLEFFIKNHPGINNRALNLTISGLISARLEIYVFRLQQEVNRLRLLDLAVVACGLERYRLANGQFPEKLGDIAPQFLAKVPNDIVNGDPLRYRRLDDGRYLLYAIGVDGKDYGGRPGLDLVSRGFDSQSDLVWPGLPKAK